MTTTQQILPGSVIAILGGGHMGRRTALAAKALGYKVHVLECDGSAESTGVADMTVRARPNNLLAVTEVVRGASVITTSMEEIPLESLETAAVFGPARPGVQALALTHDRVQERQWLDARGIHTGPWRSAETRYELLAASREFGSPCYVKPRIRRLGDAGPVLVASPSEAADAWERLRGRTCIVEAALPVELELSVLVARGFAGEIRAYPPALSIRDHGTLTMSAVPAPVPDPLTAKVRQLASYVAAKLEVEGLLTVEMFYLRDGRLVVNELVANAHATYHAADVACATGQFEQLVRAITGLPLGATDVVRAAASVPLRGAIWSDEKPPGFDDALRVPGAQLHLYGGLQRAVARLVGHLTVPGDTATAAMEAALFAHDRLTGTPTRRGVLRRRRRGQLLTP